MSRALLTAAFLLATTALADGGWTTYRGDGFSIAVPPGWRANPKFEDDGYGFYQGSQDDRLFGTAFNPSTDPQPSSNLRAPYPMLAIERLPPASRCNADAFIVDPPPDSFASEPTDTANFARTTAEPGDLYGAEQQVFVLSTQPCVAAHLYIAYAQRTGRKTDRPYDRAAVFGLFERMRRSVRIP